MKGFSLVEVLIAMALIATTAVGLADLFLLSSRVAHESRVDSAATATAQSKMAQLRGLTWAYDAAGAGTAVADTTTDLSVDPPGAGGAGLSFSPAGSLTSSVGGYVDYVNGDGRYAGRGTAPPPAAVYLRRWSIQPLPGDAAHSLVLQVMATRVTRPRAREVHLVSILTRTAR